MARGTPVISTRAQAIREVLADAAFFVPFRDPGAIADAAESLLRQPSLRADLAARGLEHAAQFSWEKAAEATLAVYRELTG